MKDFAIRIYPESTFNTLLFLSSSVASHKNRFNTPGIPIRWDVKGPNHLTLSSSFDLILASFLSKIILILFWSIVSPLLLCSNTNNYLLHSLDDPSVKCIQKFLILFSWKIRNGEKIDFQTYFFFFLSLFWIQILTITRERKDRESSFRLRNVCIYKTKKWILEFL